MNSCELRFRGFDAASERGLIRWNLFLHHDVRDVLLTARADALRVLHDGPADLEGWSTTLLAAGFPAPDVGLSQKAVAAEDRVGAVT